MSNTFNEQVLFNNGTQTFGNASVSGDLEVTGTIRGGLIELPPGEAFSLDETLRSGNTSGIGLSVGISTINSLQSTEISVGVATVGFLTAQNLSVSGIITTTTLKVNTIQNLNGVDITNNIIQVVTTKWDTTVGGNAYITQTSYTDSGASVSITPKISGSTMIITVNARLGSSYGSYIDHNWQIRDNSGAVLPNYTNSLEFIQRLQTGSGTSYMFMQVLHTNVTSAQTYKLYGKQAGGNGIYIFQPVIFTVMEVRV